MSYYLNTNAMKQIVLILFTLLTFVKIVFAQDSEPDYLCFEVKKGTTITFSSYTQLEYSFDKNTWHSLSESGVTVK